MTDEEDEPDRKNIARIKITAGSFDEEELRDELRGAIEKGTDFETEARRSYSLFVYAELPEDDDRDE